MTIEETKKRIAETLPIFEAKVASGEIKIRKLKYDKRGPSIRGDGVHGMKKSEPEE